MSLAKALAQAVAHVAEDIRGAFGIVRRRVRRACIPAETRNQIWKYLVISNDS